MCELIDRYINIGISQGIDQGIDQGINQGRTEDILDLLSELGAVPEQLKTKIMRQKDTSILKQWLKLAARSQSFAEFEQQMGG